MIIGIGNDMRGDDAAGLLVARGVRKACPQTDVRELCGEGAGLIDLLENAESAIVIDAVQADGDAGRIHRFDAHAGPIPAKFFNYSTHAFSVAEAVEMARALDMLPDQLIIYGIEGQSFGMGAPLTPAVSTAIDLLITELTGTA
ncbi:MAG: hydrogenase maturation protease [Rhodothermales bacterium]|jgi:hydrogenase maturation protease